MKTYKMLDQLFPRSFTAKVFFVAFVGTHVPLIALVSYVLIGTNGWQGRSDVLLMVLCATLIGTVATLLSLQAILQPLYRVEQGMRAFEEAGVISDLPTIYNDELGSLMRWTNSLTFQVGARIDATQRSADLDPLTSVFNRRGFERLVPPESQGAIIHLDLDNFKSVNDTFGHETGDHTLRLVAEVTQRSLRQGDILARFGGEEFVVFLPDAQEIDAVRIADRIRVAIAGEVKVRTQSITASLGVSAGRGSVDEMLRLADAATYAAKKAGRNRVIVASGHVA